MRVRKLPVSVGRGRGSWARLCRPFTLILVSLVMAVSIPTPLLAQGVSPSTGTTIFQGGTFVSYNSIFNWRSGLIEDNQDVPERESDRLFVHLAAITAGWSFRHDFQLLATVPILHKARSFSPGLGRDRLSRTGLGDVFLLFKHRFLRIDRQSGTTQAALTVGPKLPTGSTGARDNSGTLLPAPLQPGSGSTDFLFALAGTNVIRKFTVNVAGTYVLRTRGAREVDAGDLLELRLFANYRPYQAPFPGPEWWIGPTVVYQRTGRSQGDAEEPDSGGSIAFLGFSTLFTPWPTTTFFVSADFPVWKDLNGRQIAPGARLSIGLARQFAFGGLGL